MYISEYLVLLCACQLIYIHIHVPWSNGAPYRMSITRVMPKMIDAMLQYWEQHTVSQAPRNFIVG